MAKVNDLLAGRFKKTSTKLSKMNDLAERSSSGTLSSFSGVFRITPLSQTEEKSLEEILNEYSIENVDVKSDLKSLCAITSEVKAINNQAAILHGERIKRAQDVLKKYRDGAFSSWLIAAYGNRQTPYNFLQYFEFYSNMPKSLQKKVDTMPRQAVYTLASRSCDPKEKAKIVEEYQGETKKELLEMIRQRFPLAVKDKRSASTTEQTFTLIKQLDKQISGSGFRPSAAQKKELRKALTSLLKKI